MKKIMIAATATVVLLGAAPTMAYDIPSVDLATGTILPIWNNFDARAKCEAVCKPFGGWNGGWLTTIPGRMSVCGCQINPNIIDCKIGPGAILY
jgi:hypothetical protein